MGGSAGEPHYSGLTQISRDTVRRLSLAWSLDLENEHTLETTPLAIDGILYFSGQMSVVYAVDGATGKLLWRHDPETWKRRPAHMRYIFPANRGVAYADGKVFVGTLDGRLIALNARTGREIWSTSTVEERSLRTITGAPRIAGDLVVIGNGGGDFGSRGYVTAYSTATGEQQWRFFTAPGDPAEGYEQPAMKMAAATWSGQWWKSGTGGTVWNGMVYDPDSKLLFIGTGNSGPYNPKLRNPDGRDNLFLASIVAVDAKSGRYVWHYQVNPNEAWDYKAAADMILATIKINGKPRKVVMQAPTNGFFYVLDRGTGQLISAEKYGKVTWAERIDLKSGRPVEAPGIRYESKPVTIWPGPYGAHNWQPMSFSPRTGLVYIPTIQAGATYASLDQFVSKPVLPSAKTPFAGATMISFLKPSADEATGGIVAWDPIQQKARWRVNFPRLWNGGTMVTAGDIVFAGDGEGILHGFDATTGREVWRFDAKLGIVGAPMSYRVGRTQDVSLLVGFGGATGFSTDLVSHGWKYGAQPRRLLTFALDGKAQLPRTAPRNERVDALDPPDFVIDDKAAERGAALFVNCAMCHGGGARSAGVPGPDLRESPVALDQAAFSSLLSNGGLEANGMPRFQDYSQDELRDLYMFIRSKAREAGTGVSKHGASPGASHF